MRFLAETSQRKSIFRLQNEDERLLKCLAAQRRIYSAAKKMMTGKRVLLLILVTLTVAAYIFNKDWLSALASLTAVSSMTASKYMDLFIANRKNEAASLQQFFDVTLFSRALGTSEAEWGMNSNQFSIYSLINSVSEDLSDFRNWYQDYSAHPEPKQVFCCQNENITWDTRLRKDYIFVLYIACAVLGIAALIGAIAVNPTFSRLICAVSWFIPAIDFAWSACSSLNEDLKRLAKINEECSRIDEKLGTSPHAYVKDNLICLQGLIFEHRKLAYTIPDYFYRLKRNRYHFTAEHTAEDISRNS